MMTLLERLRRDRDWSQDQLAKVADVARSMISQYESRKRIPSIATVVRLAKAVKVKPRLLFDDFAGSSEQAS